jgi:hypothetical protein
MDLKEIFNEIKYLKELYRDISKLGDIINIYGNLYFIDIKDSEFFEISGKLTDGSKFASFMNSHICKISLEDIKVLKGAKKKDLIDLVELDDKLTYRLIIDDVERDISFTHDPSISIDCTILSDREHWSEIRYQTSVSKTDLSTEILIVMNGDRKILEIPVKSILVFNPKKDENITVKHYLYEDDTHNFNIVLLETVGELITLSMGMATI